MKYETDAHPFADSFGKIELEVSYVNPKANLLLFSLNVNNPKARKRTICGTVKSCDDAELLNIKSVRIHQKESINGWGIKALSIETYPGSGIFEPYSLSYDENTFWTDGDDDCLNAPFNNISCCANKEWCYLTKVQSFNDGKKMV